MIQTRSIFYLGFTITQDNNKLDFDEGAGELTATIDFGSFSPNELTTKVQDALNAVAATNVFTVTYDRDDRAYTITSDTSNFTLKISSGSSSGTTIFTDLGFTGADVSGAQTFTGDAAGTVYEPQFWLQSYVSSDNFQEAVDATINESANGEIEVVSFGTRKFVEFNIKFITDIAQPGDGPVKENLSGEDDARTFLQFIRQKKSFEFMADKNTRSTFQKLLLEKTPTHSNGLGYQLKEMIGQNMPGYYETGVIKCRLLE